MIKTFVDQCRKQCKYFKFETTYGTPSWSSLCFRSLQSKLQSQIHLLLSTMMKSSNASNMMDSSGVVYVGIPFTKEDTVAIPSSSSPSKSTPSSFKMSGSYGLLAFVVGVFLGLLGWVANQGWTIVSVLLFGQFDLTLASAWKQVLLCVFGAFCTGVAYWAVFQKIFRDVVVDEDEESMSCEKNNYSKDISDAVQDLGELGFVSGYFGSQVLLTAILYRPLIEIGIEYEHHSNDALNTATLVFMMMWVLCTKIRDYKRAVKRAAMSNVENVVESSSAYVQIV